MVKPELTAVDQVEDLGSPVEQEKMARIIKAESLEKKAQYKIEIHFGKDRSMSNLKPSHGALTLWESGKKLHGGGDQLMYFCGYDDCGYPMSTDNFGFYHVVCPRCSRECFLDADSRARHAEVARKEYGKNPKEFLAMPVVSDTKLFNMIPPNLADYIEKIWRRLGCNADIYLKFHPSDIRVKAEVITGKHVEIIERARELRGLAIYTLGSILRDTAAGAGARDRFLAFITS